MKKTYKFLSVMVFLSVLLGWLQNCYADVIVSPEFISDTAPIWIITLLLMLLAAGTAILAVALTVLTLIKIVNKDKENNFLESIIKILHIVFYILLLVDNVVFLAAMWVARLDEIVSAVITTAVVAGLIAISVLFWTKRQKKVISEILLLVSLLIILIMLIALFI